MCSIKLSGGGISSPSAGRRYSRLYSQNGLGSPGFSSGKHVWSMCSSESHRLSAALMDGNALCTAVASTCDCMVSESTLTCVFAIDAPWPNSTDAIEVAIAMSELVRRTSELAPLSKPSRLDSYDSDRLLVVAFANEPLSAVLIVIAMAAGRQTTGPRRSETRIRGARALPGLWTSIGETCW